MSTEIDLINQATIRTGLMALFATGVFNVTFTKADDNLLRTLKVTLDPELLPPVMEAKEGTVKRVRAPNLAQANVYDLDAKAWRSFIIDNLISISKVYS